jgi:site-specific recombinase XerD
MREEKTTPLRQRMIEDMHIRGLAEATQRAHIRNVKLFAAFLGRTPDTATPEDLRAWQLQMTKDGLSATTFNGRIISLRFFFGVTCGREEMKRYMQFHREPRKLPVVLSVEEVAALLASAPGPGLKYRAALGISYGAGLRASEVCNLKVTDIDSQRMLIHVDQGKGATPSSRTGMGTTSRPRPGRSTTTGIWAGPEPKTCGTTCRTPASTIPWSRASTTYSPRAKAKSSADA